MSVLNVVSEPMGPAYRALLNAIAKRASSFSLVWRDQLKFSASAVAFESELRAFLIREVRTDSWPGTRLIGHLAAVRLYRFTKDSLNALKRPGRLYAWRSPHWPEDFAAYDTGGNCIFGSISHEGDAFFVGSEGLGVELAKEVPGLKLEQGEMDPEYLKRPQNAKRRLSKR